MVDFSKLFDLLRISDPCVVVINTKSDFFFFQGTPIIVKDSKMWLNL